MKFPIFVLDDNNIDIFSSVQSLSDYIEEYDVDDNIALDADGVLLSLFVENSVVKVVESSESIKKGKLLAEFLGKYLKEVDTNINTDGLDLKELVALGIERIGYS